jgi:phosphoribosylformimino-5-aminoimidazole carboxamide ribotide isomerase
MRKTPYSQRPAEFAKMYKERNLLGGHVIKLGAGNDDAAKEALAAWPGNLYYDYFALHYLLC